MERAVDFVQETPTKRRKIELFYDDGGHSYNPRDHNRDYSFQDHETIATIPLSKGTLGQTHNASSGHPTLSPMQYISQPTQIISRPIPKLEADRQQPVVQVIASSPVSQPSVTPPASTNLAGKGGVFANAMAPPGTSFRLPMGAKRNESVIEISDEDEGPTYQGDSSDGELQSHRRGDIKPSTFILSAQTEIQSRPKSRFREITSNSFYKPLNSTNIEGQSKRSFLSGPTPHSSNKTESQTNPQFALSGKRAVDTVEGAYGKASRPNSQTAPAKAHVLPDETLEDIKDHQVRTKVSRILTILPGISITACKDAIIMKRGNFDDALEFLTSQEAPVNTTLSNSDRSSRLPGKPTKLPAKQKIKAAGHSIQSKWTAPQAFSQPAEPVKPLATSATSLKPRKRLVQGRKSVSLSTTEGPIAHSILPRDNDPQKSPEIDFASDSGIGTEPENKDLERRVLSFLNTCTVNDLAEIAAIADPVASSLLSKKPFNSLEAVRKISGDAKSSTKKIVKRAIGDKVVDTCIEMWKGYEAVDVLVRTCESIGKPVAERIKDWGTDVYGPNGNGEFDLLTIDHKSDSEPPLRDSGIGTPTSSAPFMDEDADTPSHAKHESHPILSQPTTMSQDITLKDYQILGLNWLALLYEKGISCILADEMGLGKTCQVIAFLAHLLEKGNAGPHLVVVPGSTIENWLREFKVFCPRLSVVPYYAGQTERISIQHRIEDNLENINVIVTTYGVAKGKEDNRFLRRLPLEACVFDEGHILKNSKSAAYEKLMKLKASFRLLLTGTPLQNNLSELVSLLAFIMPDLFKAHRSDLDVIFSHKAKTTGDSHAALLSSQRVARARSMMAPFILRRKKHQVLRHLPKKTRIVEYCEPSVTQLEIYEEEKARGLQIIADRAAGKRVGNETANVMMALRKASIHPLLFRRLYDDKTLRKMARNCLKEQEFQNSQFELCLEDMSVMVDFELHRFCERYPATMSQFRLCDKEWMNSGKVSRLAELLIRFKEHGDRVLIFSQFVMVMDILEEVMETLNMRFFRLDGQTKIDERQDMIDQFYAEEDITVFLLSTKAGGAGINLACANKVIIFDSSFNPQDDIQAENRAHRVGQTREVEVIRLVSRGTIEEQIHSLGQTKLILDDRVSGEGGKADPVGDGSEQIEKDVARAVEDMMVEQMSKEQKES